MELTWTCWVWKPSLPIWPLSCFCKVCVNVFFFFFFFFTVGVNSRTEGEVEYDFLGSLLLNGLKLRIFFFTHSRSTEDEPNTLWWSFDFSLLASPAGQSLIFFSWEMAQYVLEEHLWFPDDESPQFSLSSSANMRLTFVVLKCLYCYWCYLVQTFRYPIGVNCNITIIWPNSCKNNDILISLCVVCWSN